MSEKKEHKVFYINHSGELLIWLIIILISTIMLFIQHIRPSNSAYEFKIFMPDVDGLIVGSPVRVMGIQIGHVTDIKPLKDEVFIKFVITDKSVKLPHGTAATVEFSGMAGSKSLELYLPDKDTYIDSTVPTLTVHSPRRLSDSVGLLNEMFKSVGKIIALSSKFGSKISEIDFPDSDNMGNPHEFLKYVDDVIDVQQKRVDDFGDKLDEFGRKLNVKKLQ